MNVGDRVRMIYDEDYVSAGQMGTILAIPDIPNSSFKNIGVQWDTPNLEYFHTCGYRCEHGYGYWVSAGNIELVNGSDYEDELI